MRRLLIAALVALAPALAFAQQALIAPTAAPSDNSNRIATTAWVTANGGGGGGITQLTGDITAGPGSGSQAATLAAVNTNVGSFGSATSCIITTQNAKGLTTAISAVTCTPALGSITGFGTSVAAALAINIGSAGAPVLFNGAGGTPSSVTLTNGAGLPVAALVGGSSTTVAHGGGSPAFGSVVSADMNITTTSCTNQFVTAISAGGVGTCTTDTLAGAQHANQGTTTTVLHGNAAGNPSFGAVALTTDVSGTLPIGNGGTGDTGTGWGGAYTPTCAATTGTFTCSGRFLQIGKTVFVSIDILFTSAVTGQLSVTIPAAGKTKVALNGQNIAAGDTCSAANASAGSSTLFVFASAGAQYTANATHLIMNGIYEAN